jgi:CRISPR system Cascade subunit CasD
MSNLFTMRLTAPIASFSGPRIDTVGDSLPIPTRSIITGIIGAALGISYDQPEVLQRVQDTMRLAVVVHRAGTVVRDYQTVRMALPHMTGPMWWHDGKRLGVMERAGGEPDRTITGERPLTCDYDATVIVELLHGAPFEASQIFHALRSPIFPLCIGQRSCIPSMPVAGNMLEVTTLIDGLSMVGPGIVYLPVECTQAREFGDLYVTIPAGREWKSREHGGTDTYVIRN